MAWLDDFLSFVLSVAGVRIDRVGGPTGRGLNFSQAFQATVNAATGNVDVDLATTILTPNFTDPSITGTLTQGNLVQDTGTATTAGGASQSAVVSVPVASGELRGFYLCVRASDGAKKYIYETPIGEAIATFGGSLSYLLGTPAASSDFPLSPTYTVTYSAGTLSVAVTGPKATITGTADNGSGKLRVTVASGTPATLVSWGGTINLTLAGLSGTPGGNGSHAATYVSATQFDLTGVAYVAPDASGTVTETTPRTVSWGLALRVV